MLYFMIVMTIQKYVLQRLSQISHDIYRTRETDETNGHFKEISPGSASLCKIVHIHYE